MPRRLERQDAEQERNRQGPRLFEESLERGAVVEGLRHRDVRASLDLLLEAIDFMVEVFSRWIDRAGDGEAGWPADRGAEPVVALVESGEDFDQADRVDVPDAGGGGVVADTRRIAGERDDVANAERVGADEFRLQRHQVFVARGEVDQGVDANLRLDHQRQRQRTHPYAGHRAVADVDRVRARCFDKLRAGDALGGVQTARRIDLHANDEFVVAQILREWGRRQLVDRIEVEGNGEGGFVGLDFGCGGFWFECRPHRRDVCGCRAATTADVGNAEVRRLAREGGEVFGGREVEEAAFDPRRQAGVRLAGQGTAGLMAHGFEHLERDLGTDPAVDADDVDARAFERLDHLARFLRAQGEAVFGEGHLGHDRKIGGFGRGDGGEEFWQVGEG